MNWLIFAPILVPFASALALLWMDNLRNKQRLLTVAMGGYLVATISLFIQVRETGFVVSQMGGWPAPYGISLVADLFSSILLVMSGVVGFSSALYSMGSEETEKRSRGYHPLFCVLMMGVSGAFLSGDIFNLYVWFEVMLVASFVLMGLGGRPAQLSAATKYVTLNLLASTFFLSAVALLYGLLGTLNLADLAQKIAAHPQDEALQGAVALFFIAFGLKAGVFPLFSWLPASYHTLPPALAALFAGLLTKVGVYALVRAFTLLFVSAPQTSHQVVLWVAVATMVVGVLGAAHHREIHRILSFHIVSQIGYMILGLALFSRLALAGTVFYLIHHIVVKSNLFLVGGIIQQLKGHVRLDDLGGLGRDRRLLALLFLIPALSLAGIPPLSGFFSKFILIRAGLESGAYLAVAAAVGVGLLTLFSMIKIWNEAFWKAEPVKSTARSENVGTMLLACGLLAAGTLFISGGAGMVMSLALDAADQLMDPDLYIQAVLKGRNG